MRKMLYSVARNSGGDLIHAADAEKGESFSCGFCKDPLVLRKSGKTGRGSKRPHFAHKALTPNCSPETALHFEFKNMLAAEIRKRIAAGGDLLIAWKCDYCWQRHSGNLIKKAKRLEVEYAMGVCRPDLALLDENGNAVAVIEIVVTHAPEVAVRAHYRRKRITLVELHLTSEEDLLDVVGKLSAAESVQLCTDRARCLRCGHFQEPIQMKIIEAPCYNCNTYMSVPWIEGDGERNSYVGPDEFDHVERKLAGEKGALIAKQYSRTIGREYWATTCPRCKHFIGKYYLSDYIRNYSREVPRVTIPLGHFCGRCVALESDRMPVDPESYEK